MPSMSGVVSLELGLTDTEIALRRATATCTAVAIVAADGAPVERVSHRATVETAWVEDAASIAMSRAVDGATREATALIEARRAAAA